MKRIEITLIILFIILIVVCNTHLHKADHELLLHFDKASVMNGEWWRIITHPFVHVSWYHLLLDTAAVAILWQEIRLSSVLQKLFVGCCCAAGSLLIAAWFSPEINQYGLCGLSGTAHGMMFFLGLSWIVQSFRTGTIQRTQLAAGLILAWISGLKSVIEVISGHVMLATMHAGDLGFPIVESHLGGIIGGLIAFILIGTASRNRLISANRKASLVVGGSYRKPIRPFNSLFR